MVDYEGSKDHLLSFAGMGKRPFLSTIPLFGPLVSWFRTTWLRIADQAYIDPQREQQLTFNQALINSFTEQETWLIQQDRRYIETQHDLAAVLTQTSQLKQQLNNLDAQIQALEEAHS